MGTSVLPYRYRINGLVDTSKTAIDNLELIGNSCATWITYDVMDGKWSVVINRPGNSVYSFDDDNIIGAIKLNGTGLTDQYNGVEVRFPHRDLNDQEDWIRIEIPAEDRLPNEPDNILTMDLPVMNEPIQAQIVGLIELKQARLDKIITFQTDYSKINLQAGNIVDVTNDVYGWTNKLFRIIRMEETDVDGAIVIEVTALEYDENVYDLADLYRYVRTNQDGILTQGALGTPTQPTIVKYEEDANPRVDISSITPDNTDPLNQAGIIEAMEFWISTDGTNYNLLATKKPASALTYEEDTEVTFSYNNLETSFYVKTRCVNSTTTGEFSTPTSVIFAPTQVTDALNPSTGLLDGSGAPILSTLALTALLKSLDTYLAGNTNMGNVINGSISAAAPGGIVGAPLIYHIDNNETTLGGDPGGLGYSTEMVCSPTVTFTIPSSGYYTIDVFVNFGGGGSAEENPVDSSRGIYMYCFTGFTYGSGDIINGFSPQTSVRNVDTYSDLNMLSSTYLPAGNYHFEFWYYTQTATYMGWDLRVLGPWPDYGSQEIGTPT
jgi:hypothetical protein